MTPERSGQIKALFEAACQRPPGDREAWLAQSCAGDQALRAEVARLLNANQQADGFLDAPAVVGATQALNSVLSRFSPGTRLASYEILAFLGAGGMGEVYRARDTRLGRDVAIKILPGLWIGDSERRARFDREARLLAAVNHPHIAAIYGFENAGDIPALVLELVEGPTLAERIASGPLPIQEALRIAAQIAEALEAAHERGIIHRDLKPANIKVTRDDVVKVLDFGLAKAATGDAPGPDLSIVTMDQTESGLILGTAAYMSPEQARGRPVDKRTDAWAFGCVLFEMLSGQTTFAGDTVSDTIATILTREPVWDQLPAATPPEVRRLLRRCLEKDPKSRLRDIGDARLELDDALSVSRSEDRAWPKPVGMTRRDAIVSLASAAAGAAVTGAVTLRRFQGMTTRKLARFVVPLPEGGSFAASFARRIAISPDGAHVAYVVIHASEPNRLYLRSLRELEPKVLVDGGSTPFFSPDSQWVGFYNQNRPGGLRKIAIGSSAPVTIVPNELVWGASWGGNEMIYAASASPSAIARVPAAGGPLQPLVTIDFAKGERAYKFPHVLPGGKSVLFTMVGTDVDTFDDAQIAVLSAQTGEKKILVEGGTDPRYAKGHLVYARNGKLLAVGFDPQRLQIRGEPFTVLEGILMSRNTGAANFDVSGDGDLAYVPGGCDGGTRMLVWVDRAGQVEPLPLPPRSYLHPRISPDGRQLALEIEGPSHDLYVYDFARGVLSNATTDGVSHWPIWSPDGTQLAYRAGPMGNFKLWRAAADRSGQPQRLAATEQSQSAGSWSPDGHAITYIAAGPGSPPHIMVMPLDGAASRPFETSRFPEGSPKFSPDGRWLAYCSNESGKPQVYVRAYPGPGPKIQISTDGGTDPVWKRNAGELFYRNGDSMMTVTVSTDRTLTAGRPQELWKGRYSHGMSTSCGPAGVTSSNYDVTADGARFLMIRDQDQETITSRQLVVVLGWGDELSRSSSKT